MWTKTIKCLNIIVFFALFTISDIKGEDVGEQCEANNAGAEGTCTLVMDCEVALKEIRVNRRHSFRRCGFSGIQEIVCCPRPNTDKFGELGSTERSDGSQRIADRECQKIIANSIPYLNLHIIGGEAASLGEFPHMVALGFDRGNGYEFDCGGSVVSENYVLTAAHCIDTLDRIEPTIVRAGVVEIGGTQFDSETDTNIAQIITHPKYTRREKYHDLALLRLQSPLSFSSTLNAVCLETRDSNPTTSLVITGWGNTNTTRNVRSNMLLKANVSAVSSTTCGESYSNWRKLPQGIAPEQLCAGDPAGLRDTCQGDSGGPLQGSDSAGNYRLVGITSFGRGCGSPVPGVYTRIARYLDWIEQNVWPR